MKRNTIFKRKSMAYKILLTLLSLVLLEGAVFLVMLFGGNIQQEIKNSAFESFSDKIETRKNSLEDSLISKVYKADIYTNLIELCNKERASVSSVDELKVNTEIANNLKQLLYNTSSSGAFIVFDHSGNTHNGLSLRDTEPTNVSINDGDLLAEFGSSELIKEIGLTLDYQWKSNITIDDTSAYDFFNKPMQAAKEYPDYKSLDLAYWSQPYHMTQDDDESISFTFPLLDDNNEPYGIVGIQFTLSYIKSLLPYEEINGGEGAYALTYQTRGTSEFQPVLMSGPLFNNLTSSFTIHETNESKDIYTVDASTKEKTNASVHEINLYNRNSPFISESWALVGLVPESILLSALQDIIQSLLIAIITTILIGIIATFMMSFYFSKPFVVLLRTLHNADPNRPIHLPRVNINELDQLSNVVENMSNSILESSSRLSNIIQLMDLPLGAMEIDITNNKVFCTKKIAELMSFSKENAQKDYLTLEEFTKEDNKFKELVIQFEKETIEASGVVVYLAQVLNKDEKTSWLRFSVMRLETKTLLTITDVTKESLEKQKLEYERDYDILTNLLNRRAFHEEFDDIIKNKELKFSALILWDLDNLKYINDTYGHDFGDLYIKEAANYFFDLNPNHAISSRMAGDEFLVFLYGIETREELLKIAQNLHHEMTMQELTLSNNEKVRIRASAGIAWYPDDGKIYEDLLKHADYAMYTAKHTLKGSMGIFDYQSFKDEYLLFETLEELNQILDEKLYQFAFQPIIDATNGECFGYEALIRPSGKTIQTPMDLIRIARSQSKLQMIELITFTGALKAFHQQKEAFKDAKLFINSIPKITWKDTIVNKIQETYGDDLHRVVVEIIESDQMTSDNLQLKRAVIKEWNAAIALDDFGSGYNNDTAILSIHPNYLKIDQELIQNIDQDERRQMIVRNLIQYAKSQDIKVIAEGVETYEELTFLISEKVDYLQGFYLAKPNFRVIELSQKKKKEIIALVKKYNKE